MESENQINLSPNHKRVITTTVRLVEKELDEIESLISNNNKLVSSEVKILLTKQQKRKISLIMEECREANEKMFYEFNLRKEITTDRQIINSKVNYLITVLLDSTSERLKGYGKLDKNSATLVDENFQNLIENLKIVESILSE